VLSERVKQWPEHWEEKGRQEGRQERIEGTLRIKFGDLPEWADQRLMDATDEQLDEWVMQILSADSLEALLGER